MNHTVFITGGTGYMGSGLIPLLTRQGHRVTALVRSGSEGKSAGNARKCVGDALQMDSYTSAVRGADTFVHLIGVPHPGPAKGKQYWEIDLVAAQAAIKAAREAGVKHFIYLSGALLPFYWLCERLPATRDGAERLGLVTLAQMLNTLVWAVENPFAGGQILDVPKIRTFAKSVGLA